MFFEQAIGEEVDRTSLCEATFFLSAVVSVSTSLLLDFLENRANVLELIAKYKRGILWLGGR